MMQLSEIDFFNDDTPEPLFDASAASIRGARNKENQDSYMTLSELGIYAVCDGMGGHAGGQVASKLATDTLHNTLELDNLEALSIEYLTYLIEYTNRMTYQHAYEHFELRGMGSTLVLAWITNDQLQLFHVGDSRAYRLRDFRLTRLTKDHTSNNGKGISRALGTKNTVEVEHHSWDWQTDDRLLLLSDGISDVVNDLQLTNLLVETSDSIKAKIFRIIEAAITAGGDDDKTAMLIQNMPTPPKPETETEKPNQLT
jgi:protein phosphatase